MSDYDGVYDSEDEYESEEDEAARYERDRDEYVDESRYSNW